MAEQIQAERVRKGRIARRRRQPQLIALLRFQALQYGLLRSLAAESAEGLHETFITTEQRE